MDAQIAVLIGSMIGIAGLVQTLKESVVKPLKTRFNLSDELYRVILWGIAGVLSLLVAVGLGNNGDLLVIAGMADAPSIAGVLLTAGLLAIGNEGMVHQALDIIAGLSNRAQGKIQ